MTSRQPSAAPFAASLIIPLFNKVAYTAECLTSIAEHTDPALYEVVLVDNGSTDATGDLLDQLGGDVRTVRNPTNLGFARGCNQGAEAASGRHLVFCNNDVEARPGWLEPLLTILDDEPDVAIVGARLLFPDGTVQHGGVRTVLMADGGLLATHHPYGVPPVRETRRDLDAVTGALMAVRREFFESVGGFSTGYWNGMEDIDLCLTARSRGLRVVYEPRSTLVHHESKSGPERFAATDENEALFVQRWGDRYVPEFLADAQMNARPNPARRDGAFTTT
ncbi:MAG: glycosyltransferase family 2 protein [Cellulomonas sp.]|jgi:GT2 family glycosyltransferase|nr:glycosyltransferase family 2 protein [Cellulomonas sp.]